MEILIYSGIPGSGKTLDATNDALKHFKKENNLIKKIAVTVLAKLGVVKAKDKLNYYKLFPHRK